VCSSTLLCYNVLVCRGDGKYINCYTVASHGHVQTQQWIHHFHTELTNSTRTQLDIDNGVVESTDSKQAVMMQLLRDVVFRQIDSVPDCVPQPPQSCLKFVVSRDVGVTSWQTSRQKSDNNHDLHAATTPPPVPAKPLNLSVSESMKHAGTQGQHSAVVSTDRPSCHVSESPLMTSCSLTDVNDQSTATPESDLLLCPVTGVSSVHDRPQVTDRLAKSLKCEETEISAADSDRDDDDDDDDDDGLLTVTDRRTDDVSDGGHRAETLNDLSTALCVTAMSSLSSSYSSDDDVDKAAAAADSMNNHISSSCSRPVHLDDCSRTQNSECRDKEQSDTTAASDLDRLYSFVRKKADRCQSRSTVRCSLVGLVAGNDAVQLESLKPRLAETVSDVEIQTCSHVSDVHHVNAAAAAAAAADVQLPSTALTVSSPHVASASDDAPVSCHRRAERINDMLTNGHVTGVTSQRSDAAAAAAAAAGGEWSRVMTHGSLLLAYPATTTSLYVSDSSTQPLTKNELDCFVGTLLAYDRQGCAFYVPAVDMKVLGDPAGEPWFFPVPLTALQATILLTTNCSEGCFLAYRQLVLCEADTGGQYSLSVCTGTDVLHYGIVTNTHGDVSIAGHQHSFLSLSELITYFQHNKSSLAIRLGRPLSTAHLPVTAGVDYDVRYELARCRLRLSGHIIANGRFGVICAGKYRSQPVAVKVQLLLVC